MPAPSCYHACLARQLTIRGVSDEVGHRLQEMSKAREQSVSATVLEILETAVGVEPRRLQLARYATWSEEDRRQFEHALRAQRTVDEESWR